MTTSVCPSGDERVQLFGLLLETNARLQRDLGAALEESCGLPLAWFSVLLGLRRQPAGRMRMSEIADATVHSTGGTTRLVDRIEAAGLVSRVNCPSDRRAVHVVITESGNRALDEALGHHLAHLEHHLTDRLSRGEREELTRLLVKLNGGEPTT